jgi:hypothetical protein
MNPTQPDEEAAQGRIALWLSPEQLSFIANEWQKIPDDISPDAKDHWATIAFRAMAALHKSGITHEPQFPGDGDKYHLLSSA